MIDIPAELEQRSPLLAQVPEGDSCRAKASSDASDISRLAGDALLKHLSPDAALLDRTLGIRRFLGNGQRYFCLPSDQLALSAPELLPTPLRLELLRLVGRHAESLEAETGEAIELVAERATVTLSLYPADLGFLLLVFNRSDLPACWSIGVADGVGGVVVESQAALAIAAKHENVGAVVVEPKASNEELQSVAKVLQIANKELQSANDELVARALKFQHRNDELDFILQAVKSPLLVLTDGLIVEHANRAAVSLLGRSVCEIGDSALPSTVINWVQDCVRDATPRVGAFSFAGSDFEVSCEPYFSGFNSPENQCSANASRSDRQRFLLIFWDRTLQRAAERTALETFERLQAALDLAPDPVAIKRMDGTYSYVNAQFSQSFGLHRDVRGIAEADLLPTDLALELSALSNEALAGRVAVRREVHWQQADQMRSSLCLVFALFDADDCAHATVVVFTDVTCLLEAREDLRRQAEKLQQVIDGIGDAVVVLDRDGRIEQFNEAWRQLACESGNPGLLECDVEDSYLTHCLNRAEATYRGLPELLRKEQPFEFEYPCEVLSESRRYLLRSTPLPTGGAVLLHIDITVRYQEELNRRLTQAVFENANDIILICKPGGEVVMANPQAVAVFERPCLAGAQLFSLFSEDFLASTGREVHHLLKRGESWRGEAQAVVPGGRLIPLWGSAAVVRSDQNTHSYWIVIASNIAPLKEAQSLLSHQAFYDELTALPNRRFFQENLTAAIHRSNRSNQGFALIFIDLDRFKLVNDTYGHNVGDAFLRAVAQRLRSQLREVDFVARMGGDEFTVILEGAQRQEDISRVCQKLIDSLKPAIKIGNVELFAKCSIGVSRFPCDTHEETGLLRCADLAMYHAKQSGRDQFSFYELAMNAESSKRDEVENSMNLSLLSGGFYPVFQPIICVETRELVAVEALMRWSPSDGSVIGPETFIPIAEESGLIHQLGEMMLREAAKLISRWDAHGIGSIKVNVNVSSVQLQKNFADVLAMVIDQERIAPSRLVIEITESAMMKNFDACVSELHRIRAMGVFVALDDFGTGYSSLAHLRHLPISALKMDRSFVRDVHLSQRDQSIFRAVLTMASELGIEVVAEGVEFQSHLSVLSSLGCRLMQGYFFSPALPIGGKPDAREFSPWVSQMSAAMAFRDHELAD
ncbi:EAL domain-containing protein [Paucibacter sp. M5-1]|uniref:EAL domain-containing protein n=1 Tax=Paucibacter sp. M5-1 TaxID=3015998 RepID=UPI0022B8E7C5|nr:EAL domain-containing protein [Paucibacter sp. M5-1]MCZ7880624.1 EAL domain-containing protein [Paucibacter sp. M5-1]